VDLNTLERASKIVSVFEKVDFNYGSEKKKEINCSKD
jgi:hypothetical protein